MARLLLKIVLVVALSVLALSACDGDAKDDAAKGPASDAAAPTTDPAPSTETTASAPPLIGCTDRSSEEPQGEINSQAAGDLDGDGQEDQVVAWGRQAERVFTVKTAAGGISEWSNSNASGADPRIYGLADANEDGKPELFVSPGRNAYVLSFAGCQVRPYLNRQGESYAFDLTGQQGTGVGCVDADGDGRPDLVGLLQVPGEGTQVRWRRTVVQLDGQQARNGRVDEGTYTRPQDDAAIRLLSEVTCGEQDWTS